MSGKKESHRAALVSCLKEAGIPLVGFGMITSEKSKLADTFHVAISLIVNYSEDTIRNLDNNPQLLRQERSKIIETFKNATNSVEKLLVNLGYKAYVPYFGPEIKNFETLSNNDFPHKQAATAAGLGWIGKSSLLITPRYGPRIRLATILTDAEFETAKPITEDECGNCTLCVDACPFGVINNKNWALSVDREELIDAHICYEKGRNCFNSTGQKYRCGKCMQVCPIGRS